MTDDYILTACTADRSARKLHVAFRWKYNTVDMPPAQMGWWAHDAITSAFCEQPLMDELIPVLRAHPLGIYILYGWDFSDATADLMLQRGWRRREEPDRVFWAYRGLFDVADIWEAISEVY